MQGLGQTSTFINALRKTDGFSLFELAIGLMVVGVLTVGMLQGFNVYMSETAYKTNEGNIANIENSINHFYYEGNARYPCPAAVNAGEGDATLGEEGDCSNLAAIKLCTDPSWSTSDGYCSTSGTAADAIIIGAVPFHALRISYEPVLDVSNNKILYAVTYEKTVAASFDSNAGKIRIFSMDSQRLVALGTEDGVPDEKNFATNPPDFILFSTGDNGRGGFSKNGDANDACGPATEGYEYENCNFDAIFWASRDPEANDAGARSLVAGPTYFDDITRYQLSVPDLTWFPSPGYPNRVMTMADMVGVGTSDPKYALHVKGSILVPDELQAGGMCDDTMTNCFNPNLITEDFAQMDCETFYKAGSEKVNRAMVSISYNQLNCATGNDGSGAPAGGDAVKLPGMFKSNDCLSKNEKMIGIDATGTPICAP